MEWKVRNNRATHALFNQLEQNLGQRQWLIAHSQGNLIVADALWAISIAFGDEALADMRVFSLASPAPAWPMGIRNRRKVYGHMDDLVTLADPHNWTWLTERVLSGKFGRTAGHWRNYSGNKTPGLAAHDMKVNMFELNFANRVRRELGLTEFEKLPAPPKP
jgi:hypothetical protein